ncbi:hypothetical protein [Chlamydia vaughanii]|uniref:hypothetical protein n=1 Tax=Chlamydia vaughanii TaxID=3112552 RepID=UPI0032B0FB1E
MTISPMSSISVCNPAGSTPPPPRFAAVDSFSWSSLVFTILSGLVVIGVEIGVLVFFAMPTSWQLVATVSVAIVASVILFVLGVYHMLSKFLNVDDKLLEKKALLNTEFQCVLDQISKRKYQLDLEKTSLADTEVKLDSVREQISSLEKEVEHHSSQIEQVSLVSYEHQKQAVEDFLAKRLDKEIYHELVCSLSRTISAKAEGKEVSPLFNVPTTMNTLSQSIKNIELSLSMMRKTISDYDKETQKMKELEQREQGIIIKQPTVTKGQQDGSQPGEGGGGVDDDLF